MSMVMSRASSTALSANHISFLGNKNALDSEENLQLLRKTYIFPLFTDLVKFGRLPQLFPIIKLIIFYLQILGIASWTTSGRVAPNPDLAVRVIRAFGDLAVTGKALDESLPQYICSYLVFAIQVGWIVYMFSWFHAKRSYSHWQLNVFSFLNQLLMMLTPTVHGCLAGQAFYELATGGSSTALASAFFALSLVMWGVSVLAYRMVNRYISEAPVLCRSVMARWDCQLFNAATLIMHLMALFTRVFDAFPKWVTWAGLVVSFGWFLYTIYLAWFFAMTRFWMNMIITAVMCSGVSCCLFAIIHFAVGSRIPKYVYLFVPLGVLVVSMPIVGVIYWMRKKKIQNLLSNAAIDIDGKRPVDVLKREHFDKMVFSSKRDAICYVRIGLMCHSDLVVDFSFLRYMMEFYNYRNMIFAIAKVASFFPSELMFLSYCLQAIGPENGLDSIDQLVLFQLKRIHLLRQSSVSADASLEYQTLQKMTRDAISQVRGFWGEILNAKTQISFASLHYIRQAALSVDASFLSAIDRFPNNSAIMNEYCRFQIEALGNFSEAISSGKKILLLDQGRNLTLDHAFRSMVNVFPGYLFDGVVDGHGNIINSGMLNDSSSASLNSSTSSTRDEFDQGYEDLMATLFTHGKLRLALQQRMKRIRVAGITSTQAMTVVQLLISILIYVLILTLLPVLPAYVMDLVNCTDAITKVMSDMFKISSVCSIQATIRAGVFDGIITLESVLGLAPGTKIDAFDSPASAIVQSAQDMSIALFDALQCFVKAMNNADSFSDQTVDYQRFSDTDPVSVVMMSLRGGLTFYTYTARVVGSVTAGTPQNGLTDLKPLYREIMLNSLSLASKLRESQRTVQTRGSEYTKSMQSLIFGSTLFVAVACFLIFFISRCYNLVQLFKDCRLCSSLLRNVPADVIRESYRPVALKWQKEMIRGSNVHTAHELDIYMIMFPVSVVLSILFFIGLTCTSTLVFSERIGKIDGIFEWFDQETSTFLAIMNATVALSAGAEGGMSIQNVLVTLNRSVNELHTSHELLDTGVIGSDANLDTTYFRTECSNLSTTNGDEYFKCLSIDNRFNLAVSVINSLHNKGEWSDLNQPDYASLIYLVTQYLISDLVKLQDSIVGYSSRTSDSAYQVAMITAVVGIIVSILSYLLEQLLLFSFRQSIDAVKQLISLLPPLAVVSSSTLMDFIISTTKQGRSECTMTAPESILSSASAAAIVMDTNFVIQTVNKSVNQLFGYTPDQILGQTIQWIIPERSDAGEDDVNNSFYIILRQMLRPGNTETNISLPIQCLAENGNYITIRAALLCVRSYDLTAQSFMLLLRNMTEENEAKMRVVDAKMRAESLITSLLPKEVLNLWNSDNKCTLMKSDLATVIVMEITGLSEYVHTMSPDQLMMNLRSVYDRFDLMMPKYGAVHCVKTQDDMFIGVSGLFDHQSDPNEQVKQTVQFALDMMYDIEDLNEELDIDLHLKAGVDMGGPVSGRILESSTPVFDLFGEVVKQAMVIEEESDIGVVRIGEKVKERLNPKSFELTKCPAIIDPRRDAPISVWEVRSLDTAQ